MGGGGGSQPMCWSAIRLWPPVSVLGVRGGMHSPSPAKCPQCQGTQAEWRRTYNGHRNTCYDQIKAYMTKRGIHVDSFQQNTHMQNPYALRGAWMSHIGDIVILISKVKNTVSHPYCEFHSNSKSKSTVAVVMTGHNEDKHSCLFM